MIDLFAQYIEEREGAELLEVPHYGFITYKFGPAENGSAVCMIKDFFVAKEHRNKGIGKTLFERVKRACEDKQVSQIWCSVDLEALNWGESLSIIVTHGFKPTFCNGKTIHLFFTIEEKTNG